MEDKMSANYPELHVDWIVDLRHRMKLNYETLENFADSNKLNYLDCFWFFKGNPVVEESFKGICNVLDCDWEKVQLPHI